MAAGSIVVDLLMRTGSFITDTERAGKSLKKLNRESELLGKSIGKAIGLGVTSAVAALGGLFIAFDQVVKSAAVFKDLEEVTGGSAEGFASLSLAAAGAGVGMESIAAASVKLTKGLIGVDDESKDVGAALKALNINIQDFKRLDPIQQYEAVGKALSGFADGAGKTAVAVALFGKAGAEQLKVFKQLEEQGGRQTILTQAQIELADKYADAQAVSAAQLKLYAQVIVTSALPAVTALQNVLIDLVKEIVTTGGASAALSNDKAVQAWAQKGALAVAGFVDSLRVTSAEIAAFVATTRKEIATLGVAFDAVTSPTPFRDIGDLIVSGNGPLADSLKQRQKIIDEANKTVLAKTTINATKMEDALRKQFSAQALGLTGERLTQFSDPRSTTFGKKPPKVVFEGKETAGPKDDPTKKLLDNQLKALEAVIKREQDLLSDRNKFLGIFNDQGLLSIRSYFDAQRAILEAATSAQAAELDKQIAALKAFQNAPGRKQTDKADAQGKINDALEKRSRLEQESGQRGIELSIKQAEAERKLAQEIEALSANVLELQGNLAAAAAIRFDQQNFELIRRLTAEGNAGALTLVETLRKATIAQAEFGKAATDSQRVTEGLANAEDRIAITRQLGATTELGSLKQLGVARQAALVQMEAIVAAQEAIATASGNPALIQQAERARIELEKLQAVADPLGDKFKGIFEDSFGDALGDFITGTKSAKEAFASFADSVFQQISRMVAQNLAESLFGGGSSAGGGIASFFAGLFGGARALGGPVSPGSAFLVGERGPEMFVPSTSGSILPADQTAQMRKSSTNITQNFAITGPVDARTQSQIAAKAGLGVQSAMARNT